MIWNPYKIIYKAWLQIKLGLALEPEIKPE